MNGVTYVRCSDRGIADSVRIEVRQRAVRISIADKGTFGVKTVGDTFPIRVSAFDRVGQTYDAAFFCLRLRSAITKTLLVHFWYIILAQFHDFAARARVFVLLERAVVEIAHERCAMMLLNDIDNALIQPVLEREIHAFFHVRDDY